MFVCPLSLKGHFPVQAFSFWRVQVVVVCITSLNHKFVVCAFHYTCHRSGFYRHTDNGTSRVRNSVLLMSVFRKDPSTYTWAGSTNICFFKTDIFHLQQVVYCTCCAQSSFSMACQVWNWWWTRGALAMPTVSFNRESKSNKIVTSDISVNSKNVELLCCYTVVVQCHAS